MNELDVVTRQRAVARVLIVDDHRTFTDLLSLALSTQPDFECVGTASNGASATATALRTRPDIIVMDIQLTHENGLEITRQIRRVLPDVTVVVVSAHREVDWAQKAAKAGANAYAPKSGSLDELLDILRSCSAVQQAGGRQVPATGAERPSGDGDVRSLTAREHEVLRLMCQGFAPTAIARLLSISLNTCRGHVKSTSQGMDHADRRRWAGAPGGGRRRRRAAPGGVRPASRGTSGHAAAPRLADGPGWRDDHAATGRGGSRDQSGSSAGTERPPLTRAARSPPGRHALRHMIADESVTGWSLPRKLAMAGNAGRGYRSRRSWSGCSAS